MHALNPSQTLGRRSSDSERISYIHQEIFRRVESQQAIVLRTPHSDLASL